MKNTKDVAPSATLRMLHPWVFSIKMLSQKELQQTATGKNYAIGSKD
jgi:hypothetical protein